MADWQSFKEDTRRHYGVDTTALESAFEREQREYYMLSSSWEELSPDQVMGEPAVLWAGLPFVLHSHLNPSRAPSPWTRAIVKRLDLHTCTVADALGIAAGTEFRCAITRSGRVSGWAGWFDVDFAGTAEQPTNNITLDTSPAAGVCQE